MPRKVIAWIMVILLVLSAQGTSMLPVYASNSSSTGPSLAYNSTDNNYLMVYKSDTGGGSSEILGQFLNSSGSVSGESFQISNVDAENTGAPEILFNEELEQFFIVWQDGRGDEVQIMATILDTDGAIVNDDFEIKPNSKHQLTPLISRNPNTDSTLVLWLEADDLSDTEFDLIGAYIDESDLSSDALDFTNKSDVLSFDVTYNSTTNEFVVVWDSKVSKRTRLNVKYVDGSGDIQNGTTFISPGDGEVTSPSVTYSESANQNLIVWVDEDNSIDDVYTKYTTVSGTAIKVFSADENTEITDISITSQGSNDELLLVWTEYDGTDYTVLGNFVNDDGSSTGEDNIVIVESSSEPVETIIAFNPNDENFLVMQDDGSGEPVQSDVGVIGDVNYGALEFASLISSVSESGTADIVVERNNGSFGSVTVSYTTEAGSAGTQDFIEASGTLTFGDGVTQATLSIPIIEDGIDEEDEYFDIILSSATGGAGIGSVSTHTVTILDNDDPNGTFEFTTGTDSVLEGEAASLIVERGLGQNGSVSVEYSVSLGTASGDDLTLASGTLAYSDGEATKTIDINTLEDDLTEEDETFTVTLSNATNGALLGSTSSLVVTIIDDDQKTQALNLADSSISMGEGDQVIVSVLRTGVLTGSVSVDYTTQTGTASQSDFSFASGTLTFSDSESVKTLTLSSVEDTFVEGTETFTLTLSGPTGNGYLGSIQSSEISILDDDSQAAFSSQTGTAIEGQTYTATVNRTGDTSSAATLDYTVTAGTAGGDDLVLDSGTLNFSGGNGSKTIVVSTIDDNQVEADENFTIALSNTSGNLTLGAYDVQTVTLSDNDIESETFNFNASTSDVEEGSIKAVSVVRSGSLNGTQTVDYTVVYGTALAGDVTVSNGTLTFGDGVSSQSILVTALDDSEVEGEESLQLTLSNPSGSAGLGDLINHTVTIADNDSSIAFEKSAATTLEGGSVTLSVVRTGELSLQNTVNYETQDDLASASDYSSTSGVLTFAPGESKKTITVETTDDALTESDETFKLVLSGPSGNAQLGALSEISVSIVDNDQMTDTLVFTSDSLIIEEGDSATVQVTRLGSLEGQVQVDYSAVASTAGLSDYTLAGGSLVFGDDENSKTIIVETLEDATIEPNEVFTIVLSNPAGGAQLGGIDQMEVIISDDDSQIEFSTGSGSVVEGQTYEALVTRTGYFFREDSVDYSSNSLTAGSLDYTEVSGTLIFAEGESSKTIQVNITDDVAVEETETFELSLDNTSPDAVIGTQNKHTVSVLENDINIDTFNFASSSLDIEEGDTQNLTVLRSGSLQGTVTVNYSVVEDTASGADYSLTSGLLSFAENESSKAIAIVTSEDTILENTETLSLVLSNPSGLSKIGAVGTTVVSIIDDDAQIGLTSGTKSVVEGEAVSITLTRTGNTASAASVEYRSVIVSADSTDFTPVSGTITFEGGETVKTVMVLTTEDTISEADETFKLVLENPDVNTSLGELNEVTITISDDDAQANTFNLASSSKTVSEGDSVQISVVRTGSETGTVSVAYGLSAGTATTADYSITAGTLVFEDGEVVKKITVETIEDTDIENTEYFTLQLVNPSSGAKLGSLSSAKISILDDDKQEDDASFSTGLLTVKEGETIKLTIERKGDLNGEVTIDYLVTDGTAGSGDVSSTQGRVTFKSGESSATIEIPVVADNVEEAEEYLYVLLHNPSTGLSVGDVSTVIVVIENAVVVQASSGGGSSRSESASQSSGSSDSAAVVTSLSNVLIDKSTEDKNVQPQTIEAYYSHIDRALESIGEASSMRDAPACRKSSRTS